MAWVHDGVARLKDPNYTGENRCLPCTAVNLVIAFVLALGVEIAAIAADAGTVALPFAVAVFALGVAAIYFRGYLVPGTPTLTKRYMPAWALSAFGKEKQVEGLRSPDQQAEPVEEIDVETVLLDAGALRERVDGEDLVLTDEFQRALDEQIDVVRDDDASRERLLDVLDVDRGEVQFEEYGDAFRVRHDGRPVGTWESRPAFLADVAAAELLQERVDLWERLQVQQRGQLLNGLRLFLTTCPGCGGDLAFGMDTVESCCSTRDVAAVTCEDCDARLFESDAVA